MKNRLRFLSLFLFMTIFSLVSIAQVSVSGQVKDDSGNSLTGVNIVVQGTTDGTTTNTTGDFSITIPKQNSTLVFSFLGFETLEVPVGNQTNLTVKMESTSMNLDQVVVSASRKKEKVLEAPASIAVISAKEVTNNVSLTATDHLYSASGVDVSKTGLTSSNVVTRGFNNIFSGAVLTMVDNRVASVPSLRVNSSQMIPGNSDDIASIEVLKGPASAIYGPFSANGVVHIITKSPLDMEKDAETKVSFGVGDRDLLTTSIRSAGKITDNFGYKISGSYLRGTDWDRDSNEVATEMEAWETGQIHLSKQGPDGTVMTGDSAAVDAINSIENWNIDARLDYKIADDTKVILSAGRSNSNGIEMTGLGAGQAVDWSYSYWQARFLHKNLFIQAYGNESDAGESFMRRSGNLIVDNSQFISYQIQHSVDIGNLSLTYGADAYLTRPKTFGTINGNNEFTDNIDEKGAYIQGKYSFNSKLDFISAVRFDNHTFVEGTQVSPRYALVYKMNPRSTFRLSYNEAFESPSALNYSLDILSGNLPTGIGVRGIGNRNGFAFNRDETGAINNYYSPFAPGVEFDFDDAMGTNISWGIVKDQLVQVGVQIQLVQDYASILGQTNEEMASLLINEIFPQEGLVGLTNSLMVLNLDENAASPFTVISADMLKDVDPLSNSFSTTKETGYKGFLSDKLAITVDVYQTQITDFVGSLQVMNPNVFVDGASAYAALMNEEAINETAGSWILTLTGADGFDLDGDGMPDDYNGDGIADVTSTTDILTMMIDNDPAYGGNGNGSMVDELAALTASIPYGTVMPEGHEGNDVIMTYANFGDVTVNGLDFAATYYLNSKTKIAGTYSLVDKNEFETAEGIIVPLNAPAKKASLSVATKLFNTFDVNLRYRWQDKFPINSGVYVGELDAFAVADLTVGYNLLENSRIDLSVQNISDNVHNEFVGAPQMGRLAMLRFSHTF